MSNNLRKAKLGHQLNWTKDEVLSGLDHFYQLHHRYPTAYEIDGFEFLPSSRSIQRQFGGLVTLRKDLIPNSQSNYTTGAYRSNVAKLTNDRATKYEGEFYDFLTLHFDPIAVHEHKVIRPGNVSCDYFIYFNEANEGLIIDLFYAQDVHSLSGVINYKQKRYGGLPFKTVFVLVGNVEISIHIIRELVKRRRDPLPTNVLVDSEANFKDSTVKLIKKLSKYSRD